MEESFEAVEYFLRHSPNLEVLDLGKGSVRVNGLLFNFFQYYKFSNSLNHRYYLHFFIYRRMVKKSYICFFVHTTYNMIWRFCFDVVRRMKKSLSWWMNFSTACVIAPTNSYSIK